MENAERNHKKCCLLLCAVRAKRVLPTSVCCHERSLWHRPWASHWMIASHQMLVISCNAPCTAPLGACLHSCTWLGLFASTVFCPARFITNVSLVCFITYYTHVHRSIRMCVCEYLCHVIILCPRNKCLNRSALFALRPFFGVCVCLGHTNPWRALSSFRPVSLSQQLCPFEFSCHLAIVFRHFACSRSSSTSDLSALELSECKCGLWQVPLLFPFHSPSPWFMVSLLSAA